ncbi:MAG TPA: sigma-70 family RNA polymerase sigma factor [Verrucomicrobiota bacterium]|nr:sigma-70 family RNA polymerase sigma factor [Verrucomicrobiota bacterium]
MEEADAEIIKKVLNGNTASFEPLITKYQGRIFAIARRYTNNESDAQDIVQEVWIKAFSKLSSYRGEAPFEHWLTRLAVHICYDFLRRKKRGPEITFSDIGDGEQDWLERFKMDPNLAKEDEEAAKALIDKLLSQLSPSSRLVITLLEIEDKSVKEVAELTGWSPALVKVRAFRARAEMKKCLSKIIKSKYL